MLLEVLIWFLYKEEINKLYEYFRYWKDTCYFEFNMINFIDVIYLYYF